MRVPTSRHSEFGCKYGLDDWILGATLGPTGAREAVAGVTWVVNAVEGSWKNRPGKSLEHKAEKEKKDLGSKRPTLT